MNTAVVIATSEGRQNWAADCLASIDVPFPVIIVSTGGYELGKLTWVYKNTNIDRFAFLQDSVTIKDNNIFKSILEDSGSVCLNHDGNTCMNGYNGIYERSVLDELEIPVANSKTDSIRYEGGFAATYQAKTKVQHLFDPAPKVPALSVEKYGRENRVFENDLLFKWKANWGQIPEKEWDSHDLSYQEILRNND